MQLHTYNTILYRYTTTFGPDLSRFVDQLCTDIFSTTYFQITRLKALRDNVVTIFLTVYRVQHTNLDLSAFLRLEHANIIRIKSLLILCRKVYSYFRTVSITLRLPKSYCGCGLLIENEIVHSSRLFQTFLCW